MNISISRILKMCYDHDVKITFSYNIHTLGYRIDVRKNEESQPSILTKGILLNIPELDCDMDKDLDSSVSRKIESLLKDLKETKGESNDEDILGHI